MNGQMQVNRVNGEVRGELVVSDFIAEPRKSQTAAITLRNRAGDESTIDLAKVQALNLLGIESISDSTASDVAGIVADFNVLLAVLRTANVIA